MQQSGEGVTFGAVGAAFVVALILTVPAAFCVGLVWRLVECAYGWSQDCRRWWRHR